MGHLSPRPATARLRHGRPPVRRLSPPASPSASLTVSQESGRAWRRPRPRARSNLRLPEPTGLGAALLGPQVRPARCLCSVLSCAPRPADPPPQRSPSGGFLAVRPRPQARLEARARPISATERLTPRRKSWRDERKHYDRPMSPNRPPYREARTSHLLAPTQTHTTHHTHLCERIVGAEERSRDGAASTPLPSSSPLP